MRKLGDQWIENGRMYKAVKPVSNDDNCVGCCFADSRLGHCIGCLQGIVKDLGPVNEEGCLPMPCDGKTYPEVAELIGDVWIAKAQSKNSYMEARGRGKQACKDAWNHREAL